MPPDCDSCQFRILGPVQVIVAGKPVGFARRQHLDLAAFLLLHAERVVTAGQIIDAMWGEAAPRSASVQVKNMLSALRGVLHHGDRPLATVDRQPAGYRLHIVAGQLDLSLFTDRVAKARAAPSAAETARLLRSALALWQGAIPLAGVRAAFAEAARTHLNEQRDTALEELFAAELARGNHTQVVPALTDAAARNPGRERLVGQLMLALYRSGRVTDALATYDRARRVLDADFGLEPGPELRELQRRILRADPALAPPAQPVVPAPAPRSDPDGAAATGASEQSRSAGPPAAPPPDAAAPVRVAQPGGRGRPAGGRRDAAVPAQLPLEVRGFAGRRDELAALDALVTEVTDGPAAIVVTLLGTAGVGKTALAVHWAHRVADRFPDGQLYADLRGFHPGAHPLGPAEVIRGFLDAFGVPPDRIPTGADAQIALYRTMMAGRRVLVVLDNALNSEQARPLLPGTPGCMVLVTSRNALTGLVAAEGAVPITLDVLSAGEAREFLLGRLGSQRVTVEARAAEAIAQRCAGLPLALALVAARAAIHPRFPLAALVAELSAAQHSRGVLLSADDSVNDVRAAFSWSYQRLTPGAAALFRLLGRSPGPLFAVPAAASLAGLPADEVRGLLDELARAHLVIEQMPERFALHDLLRSYAAELAATTDTQPEQRAAVHRLLDHYLHTAYRAALLIYPHRNRLELPAPTPGAFPVPLDAAEAASAWFATERDALVAAVQLAADLALPGHAWRLASAMATYLDRRGHWHDWAATQRVALAAAEQAGDRAGQAHAHGSLGQAYNRLKRYPEAHEHLQRAHELFGELDDPIGQAYTHLRTSAVHEGQQHHATALRHAKQALDLFRMAGHRAGLAQALNTVGWHHAQLGQYPEAVDHCGQAVRLHRELGDEQGVAHTLDSLGFAHYRLGQYEQAIAHLEEAVELLRQAGDRYYESIALTHLGESRLAAGDPAAARAALRRAVEILDDLAHPDAEQVAERLMRLDDPLA